MFSTGRVLYAVRVGDWNLTDLPRQLRCAEYLLRGGFFMADDFWGKIEWEAFMASMRRVFPDRSPVDIEDANQMFHATLRSR